MDYMAEFLRIYKENIKREGSAELLNYLQNKSDFFKAPASGRFHLSVEGGLLMHSVHVAQVIMNFKEENPVLYAACFTICAKPIFTRFHTGM